MPQERIPFTADQRSGQSLLAGGSSLAMNVIVDQLGAVYRRPCLKAWHNTNTIDSAGITGIYRTVGGRIFAVGGGDPAAVYEVTASGNADTQWRLTANRPVFAETEAILAVASGGQVQRFVFADDSYGLLVNAPNATHVAAQGSRLLANDNSNVDRVQFSGVASGSSYANHEVWGAGNGDAGHITAESRPDTVRAVRENTGEVFIFGDTTVEVWAPDPQFVYSRVVTREYGCSAPYGIIKRDQEFFWLDHERRIVRSDGRDYEVWSAEIQQDLDDMASVEGTYGYWVKVGPVDALVWSFPDGQTYVRQVDGGWGQWSSLGAGGAPAAFPVTAYHPEICGTSAGRVATLSMSTHTDLGDRVNSYIQTGFVNRGSDNKKRCRSVHLAVTSDDRDPDSTEVDGWLQWRDDDEGAWCDPVPLRVSEGPVVRFRSLGVYRRRQWRFTFSGTSRFVLAGVTEDFDILGS